MKRIVLAALLTGFSISTFAQTDSVQTDTTGRKKATIKIKEVGVKSKSDRAYFGIGLGFDFGWNRFIDQGIAANPQQVKDLALERGPNFGFNLITARVDLAKNHAVRLKTALGLDYNTYHFRKAITLQPDQDVLTYTIDENRNFDKNLLRSTYLRIPLLLAVRPVKDSSFELAGGGEVGVLIWGKTKQISDEAGKVKIKDTYNLEPFRYGLTFRVGYSGFNLYGKYYLNDVFAKNQGPAGLSNVAFGISFGGI
ncbi:outer membrane beta-barrel protein [Pedobacter sp. SYP-B3415]|uniref:outer membrane beta-barrel protein n=1 Tax=Pedobacter sp. SYP-B3415 TaxID=2496641 RepID=UPI00101BDDC6|nr:outer membrane beta-barrel protein [Pedobacter sp. SYP-B3415]